MPFGMIGSIIGGLLGLAGTDRTNKANIAMQRETNEHNRQMQAQANMAQLSESQKAYERSKPTTQVNNLMNAGMSQGAALSALNGGGSYSPAPISASTDQAPTMDNSGAIQSLQLMTNAAANYAQRQDEMKRFNSQQQFAADEAAAAREHDIKVKTLEHGNELQKIDVQHNYDREKWEKEFAEQQKLNAKTLEDMEQGIELKKEERERLTRMFELQLQKTQVDIAKVTADTNLSVAQRSRIEQEVAHMKEVITEWQAEGDVRKAEAAAREVIANCQQITESAGYQVTQDVLGGVMDLVKTFLPSNAVSGLLGQFLSKRKRP